jgi:hypothetical protein
MNHKFSSTALCALLIFFANLLPNITQAQTCSGCIQMQLFADRISLAALNHTSDVNYVANHASGNGNANQFNLRLARIGNGLQVIQPRAAEIFDIAIQIGDPGLMSAAQGIMDGYGEAQGAYNAIQNQVSAGLPVPVPAAEDLRDAIMGLRQAASDIRREIQELDE